MTEMQCRVKRMTENGKEVEELMLVDKIVV